MYDKCLHNAIIQECNTYYKSFMYYADSLYYNMPWKVIVSGIIAVITFIVGKIDAPILGALGVYTLDFLVWIYIAIRNGTYSKERAYSGAMKIVLFIITIAGANLVDTIITSMIDFIEVVDLKIILVKYRVILYFWVHEFISLSKKLKSLGMPIPDKLIPYMNTLKDKLSNKEIDVLYGKDKVISVERTEEAGVQVQEVEIKE